MKINIKTNSVHLVRELIGLCEQVLETPKKDHFEVLIADNSIDYVEIHFSYVTIYFKEKKYFNSGIRSYGIKRAQLISFEVIE